MSVTKLRLFKNGNEIPFPKGSDRGINFSKEFIEEAGGFARLVDGSLVYTGDAAFDVYALEIQCSDQKVPALGQIRKGDVLTVHWGDLFTEPGPAVMLSREPVPGTIKAYDANGAVIAEPEGRTLNVPGAAYFEYQPLLSAMVIDWSSSSRELAASSEWTLILQEDGSAPEIVNPDPDPVDPNPLPDELVEAIGGVVTDYTDEDGLRWRLHEFLSSGLFTVSAKGRVQALVAGAGGGGGHTAGGNLPGSGPGAGGLFLAEFDVEVGSHSVVVGAGGAHGVDGSLTSNDVNGKKGNGSTFHGISADGGGGGFGGIDTLGWLNQGSPNGGSGGGQLYPGDGRGAGDEYYGHSGGYSRGGLNDRAPGGGGGAGSAGGAGQTGVASGDAGAGVDMGWFFGEESRILCAGAAGGENTNSPGAAAGEPATGGSLQGENGAQNTGNAGGACGGTTTPQGGAGASGIVAIRYRIPAE